MLLQEIPEYAHTFNPRKKKPSYKSTIEMNPKQKSFSLIFPSHIHCFWTLSRIKIVNSILHNFSDLIIITSYLYSISYI